MIVVVEGEDLANGLVFDAAESVIAESSNLEAVAIGLVVDAAESVIAESSNLEAPGAVSDYQRLDVKRMLLDAEVSSVSKVQRIWWERGFLVANESMSWSATREEKRNKEIEALVPFLLAAPHTTEVGKMLEVQVTRRSEHCQP
eukprot:5779019-Amphidinium_carterae.1